MSRALAAPCKKPRFPEQPFHGFGIGDVRLKGLGLAMFFADRGANRVCLALALTIVDSHLCPGICQGLGNGLPESTACPRH